jgi:YfiH family protein
MSDKRGDRGDWYLDGDPAVGAVVLRCALLDRVPGITHGFATRSGGAKQFRPESERDTRSGGAKQFRPESERDTRSGGAKQFRPESERDTRLGAEGDLDFGAGADRRSRAENRRRLATRLGVHSERLFHLTQVHGARIVEVDGAESPEALREEQADGLVSCASVALGVLTADCVPVLLAERRGRAIAAVHAGWRGLAAGVLEAAVAHLEQLGVAPGTLVAAVGPCISAQAYEVGGEVADAFAPLDVDAETKVVQMRGERAHVDLAGVASRLLGRAGVGRVALSGRCTAREPALFFSHRRDGSPGRQLSVIGRLCPGGGR